MRKPGRAAPLLQTLRVIRGVSKFVNHFCLLAFMPTIYTIFFFWPEESSDIHTHSFFAFPFDRCVYMGRFSTSGNCFSYVSRFEFADDTSGRENLRFTVLLYNRFYMYARIRGYYKIRLLLWNRARCK